MNFTVTYKRFKDLFNSGVTRSATLAERLSVSEGLIRRYKRRLKAEAIEPELSPKEKKTITKKFNDSQNEIERLKRELDAATHFKQTPQFYKIEKPKKVTSFSTAVALASDWHVEEIVDPNKVSGMNEYNLKVAEKRINKFFTGVVSLSNSKARDTHIETLILALLGDFISGDIHGDIIESCCLRPMEAIMWVMPKIIGGIDYILDNTDFKLIIPCHSGNHGRTTKEQYYANERGHSAEWLMYNFLNLHFEKNKRVQFMVADGYHSYIDVNGFIVRNHHGHSIGYGGGVGGVTIPTYKKIAQWNKGKVANVDNFGHFHQQLDGGNFALNGSLIGYNSYAVQIGASFEIPQQTFYLINDKYKQPTEKSKIFVT